MQPWGIWGNQSGSNDLALEISQEVHLSQNFGVHISSMVTGNAIDPLTMGKSSQCSQAPRSSHNIKMAKPIVVTKL